MTGVVPEPRPNTPLLATSPSLIELMETHANPWGNVVPSYQDKDHGRVGDSSEAAKRSLELEPSCLFRMVWVTLHHDRRPLQASLVRDWPRPVFASATVSCLTRLPDHQTRVSHYPGYPSPRQCVRAPEQEWHHAMFRSGSACLQMPAGYGTAFSGSGCSVAPKICVALG